MKTTVRIIGLQKNGVSVALKRMKMLLESVTQNPLFSTSITKVLSDAIEKVASVVGGVGVSWNAM